MANNLTYTTGCFIECTASTSTRTAGTIFTILTATSSADRKVYGINAVNVDNAANAVKIFLNDGTSTYQVSNVNVAANSGNNTTSSPVNLFTSTMGESLFCKTRDMNGLPYFTVPKNWSIQLSLGTTPGAAETFYTFVYGEYY